VSIVRSVPLTILDGSTFCVCDERGDIDAPTAGLFAEDTRFLSRCVLTLNGERPLFLSTVQGEPFAATFFVRNPLAGGLGRDELTIARTRHVSEGMEDSVVVRSHAGRPLTFSIEVELATDFADIFAVKQYDFSLGDPLHARPLPDPLLPAARRGRRRSRALRRRVATPRGVDAAPPGRPCAGR
jgi:hypothetical protein